MNGHGQEPIFGRLDRTLDRRLKRPIAVGAVKLHLSANKLNALGVAGCLAASLLSYRGKLKPAAVCFLAFSSLDGIDGSVARLEGTAMTNTLGGWQDAYGGFVSEIGFVAATALAPRTRTSPILAVTAVGLLSLTSYAKAVAGEYAVEVKWPEAGYLGRGLRILVLSLGILLADDVSGNHRPIRRYCLTTGALLVYRVLKIYSSQYSIRSRG